MTFHLSCTYGSRVIASINTSSYIFNSQLHVPLCPLYYSSLKKSSHISHLIKSQDASLDSLRYDLQSILELECKTISNILKTNQQNELSTKTDSEYLDMEQIHYC